MKRNAEDTVVIGAGLGGLFTAAILSKNGHRVTVLEKNGMAGGGLQCFSRGGKIFETGMHVMGGFTPDGNLTRLCRYLGIDGRLSLHHIPSGCMDELHYSKTGETFRIASGKEGFAESLARVFPEEREGIFAYVDEIFRITDELPMFSMRERPEGILIHSERFAWAADRLIASYVSDPRLRELLAYLSPLYGGVAGETPAYVHALINVLFIKGASRFVGGSQQLADALCGVVESGGGRVLTGRRVAGVEVENLRATAVTAADGERFPADCVVMSAHLSQLSSMLPPGVLRPGFLRRLEEIPGSCSAFSLYIDLRPGTFPYIDHTCYLMDDFGMMWNQESVNVGSPRAFMYMTPPDPGQGKWASRMLVHCVMGFDEVRPWADSLPGRRPGEYTRWKEEYAGKIIARLCEVYPGFRDCVAAVHSSSPLTIRDYFGAKDGAIFGYRKDCRNLMLSHIPVKTKIPNLFLTGQNVNIHGICGVPLTAIHTAEAILGTNSIVRQIIESNE